MRGLLNSKQRGAAIERRAAAYLTNQGLVVIERNYRCKFGEIDLIMRDGEYLVFVEVRYRKHNNYGAPAATVDGRKQRKLVRSAQRYITANRLDLPCRFDVLGITGSNEPNWIKNAFCA